MKLFDQMMNIEVRNNFINKKNEHYLDTNEEMIKLKEYILSFECEEDIKRLKNGDYYISVPNRFYIRKIKSNRRRICYKYVDKDNYLLKLMTYVLMEFDDLYSKSLYSFRKNQNHITFFDRLRYYDKNRKSYVLKMDVHSYGESVDQDILLDMLKPIFIDDPDFYNFLYWLLKRNLYYERGTLHNERVSIIPGTPIGAFLNNVYLSQMDYYIDSHSKLYMRYADDIAVFVDSKEEAEELKDYIISTMQELKLQINDDKTHIYEPGESFSILGIKVSESEYDIAPVSLDKILFKIKKKAKKLVKKVRNKEITKDVAMQAMVKYINNYFYNANRNLRELCWIKWAFGIISTDKTLKIIDKCAQDCIREVGTGKTSNAKYRIRYSDIRNAGYKSLVHEFYKKDEKDNNE